MPLELYQHEVSKFVSQGLQLRLPVDLVPQGQYSRLDNVEPAIEGELQTRAGTTALALVSPTPTLHSIFRLNQVSSSQINSARFLGAASALYAQQLPSGTITQLLSGFDGGPLSFLDYRFDFDPASWLIIGNSAQMYKVRATVTSGTTPSYLVYPLGEKPPTQAATATIGGTGLLNNGSGPGYDWRYTFVNSTINTESNPSPIDLVGGSIQRPTTWQTPTDFLPSFSLTVTPKSQPWAFTGGINLAYNYGLNDGTAPVQYPYLLIPGQSIQIQYVSGTVKCSDSRPLVNAAGQASYITDSLGGSTGTGFPTQYMPGSQLGLGGLCGAFVSSTGQVIQPLSIGLGGTFIVPAGATRLQLGIDDDRYVDNTSTGFTVTVKGVLGSAVTNPANAIDNNPATFTTATCVAYPPTAQSVAYFGFPASGTITGLLLNVDFEVTSTGTAASGSQTSIDIQYSIDNGTTWTSLWHGDKTSSLTRNTMTATFAVGVALSQLKVRIAAAGDGTPGDTFTQSINVYEIYTTVTQGAATTLALTNQSANVCVQTPYTVDFGQDTIRLYRRGGSLVDNWYKVGDFAISTLAQGGCGSGFLQINDNVPDGSLTDGLLLDNDMPVTGITNLNTPLSFIWGQFDRRVLGVGDPSRPDAVYYSKQGNADAWPPGNWVTVSTPTDPMQAGCVYNTRCFAFSHERMYELVPGLVAGVTFSPFPTPTSRGLISPWGLCTYDRIYFVSKDGIYATTGGPETSIVENDIKPLFPTKDGPGIPVEDYEAVDMTKPNSIRLSAHNDEIYFTYAGATTGTLQQLIYDIRKNRWRPARYIPQMTSFYSEPATVSSLLMGGADGTLYQAAVGGDNGVPISVTIRTGSHDQGIPLSQKEYGNVVFDIDPGGADSTNPVLITPYINGEAQAVSGLTVTGSGRQQIPLSLSDIFAYNLEFEISWTRTDSTGGTVSLPGGGAGFGLPGINPVLYQYDILWRAEPTQLTHWETRENSYGMAGWGHLRDGYIGLRSLSTLTLSFYFDGNAVPGATLTLASTLGQRRKVPFALPANKWKLLKVTLDDLGATPLPFRVYEADCEFRLKQWLTPLGYRNLPILGAESQMVQSAYSSMILGEGRGQ